jgi:hypothetical protein
MTAGVDCHDRLGVLAVDGTVQTGAQQGIDEDIRLQARALLPLPNDNARVLCGLQLAKRIVSNAMAVSDDKDVNIQALLFRKARYDKTIAAVVAGAAQYCDASCLRPALAQNSECGRAGTLHQHRASDAMPVDRSTVQRPYTVGTVQIDWKDCRNHRH